MSDEIDFHDFPLPDWAEATIQKGPDPYLVERAQLMTRDGRRMGNAVVRKVEALTELVITAVTDMGNELVLTRSEAEELFFPPVYVMQPWAVGVRLGKTAADPKAECTNSDTWNCKYCKKNTACDALKDYRSSGGTVKPEPEPEDKADTVAQANSLKINVELLCNKLGTARVAVADAEANLKLLRDVVESQETQREKELSNMVERFIAALDHVDPSSGVCMCGDDMENHGDPEMTGHCPVDSGHYAATNLLNSARKLIGKN